MNENQKILLIVAIVYVVGIFVPIIEIVSLMQMPSIFGETTSNNSMSVSMSIFDVLTSKDKLFDFNGIDSFRMIVIAFIASLIAMPICTIIIALTKQYSWLFTISFPFLIFIFSIIYSVTLKTSASNETMGMMIKLSWGWGLLIIPSLILLVMGIIALFKKQ
jgi:hypothetical protein